MALTHHYLVQLAALRKDRNGLTELTAPSGTKPFTAYRLLGDDIVICDKAVGESYLRVINSFGMAISEPKTHISHHTYEFAKRWFMFGVEITGFGVAGLLSVRKSYALAYNFMHSQRQHGWAMTLEQALSIFRYTRKLYTTKVEVDGKQVEMPVFNARRQRGYDYLFSIF